MWTVSPPFDVVENGRQLQKVVQAGGLHFLDDVRTKVDAGGPAVIFAEFLGPLLVIGIVVGVEVQQIVAEEHEAGNARLPHLLEQGLFEGQEIVVEAIVPFAEKLDEGESLFVVGVQYF